MATNKRKERRQRELLDAGRRAEQIETAAKAAEAKALEELKATQGWFEKITAEHEALRKEHEALKAENEQRIELVGILQKENAHLDASRDLIAELNAELEKANARIAELEHEDKDAKKLRRRLKDAKDQLLALQSRVNKENQAQAW